MNKLRLQEIVFPVSSICNEQEMYFRVEKLSKGKCLYNEVDGYLSVNNRAIVTFDTYFNGFSIAKWNKYTRLDKYHLDLTIDGSFLVSIRTRQIIAGEIITKTLTVEKASSEKKDTITICVPRCQNGSVLYIDLQSMKKESKLYGGEFFIDEDDYTLNGVKLGLAICTYKREEYIDRNIQILKDAILDNEQSALFGNTDIFISDNGQSLEAEKYTSDNIHMFSNINAGGAGGFTRAMIEMIKSDHEITHTILMDDDIVINVESINKTFMILKLLKEEYSNAFIGGSMLPLDRQNKLVESGAVWNKGFLASNKRGLDLNKLIGVLKNEIEEYTEYNAWWFCCFPLSVPSQDNLPLPIFIRGDDVEYGLRNTKNLILMNGICVWHEAFENKYSSWINLS